MPDPVELTSEEHLALQRNGRFRDLHKGQRCFIIGTGPSLANQDLEPLAGEITYTMSGFWKHEIVNQWHPTYYCICDPIYFDGSESTVAFLRSIGSRVNCSTFFIPLFGRGIVSERQLLPPEQTYWISFHGDLGSRPLKKVDLTEPIPSAMTVSQFCLMAAIYMGCSPIYLLGLDHNWLSDSKVGHFYRGSAGLEHHPGIKPDLKDHSYKFILECALVVWKGYEVLLELATRKGIQIINATDGGCLDVFERANYREIVAKSAPATEILS